MYPVTKGFFLYFVFLYILGYDKNIYSYWLNLNVHVLFLKRLTNSRTLKHEKSSHGLKMLDVCLHNWGKPPCTSLIQMEGFKRMGRK